MDDLLVRNAIQHQVWVETLHNKMIIHISYCMTRKTMSEKNGIMFFDSVASNSRKIV
jgi:hypothetical protein